MADKETVKDELGRTVVANKDDVDMSKELKDSAEPYVVTAPCIGKCHMECIEICPPVAFHFDPELDMVVINPDTCIGCDACVNECPEEAIFALSKLPEEFSQWTQINKDRAALFPATDEVPDDENQFALL